MKNCSNRTNLEHTAKTIKTQPKKHRLKVVQSIKNIQIINSTKIIRNKTDITSLTFQNIKNILNIET